MYVEKKLKINAEKVSFAKAFPGLLKNWETASGKTIKAVVPMNKGKTDLVIFTDATFIFAPSLDLQPAVLIASLLTAKPFLEGQHQTAYEILDRLMVEDKEMQRMARLENIMGAIRNNLPQIPELKKELQHFLDKTDAV